MPRLDYRVTTAKVVTNLLYCLLFSAISFSFQAQAYVYDQDPNALLGSSHGGSALWDFCYGKTDETVLPADPRSLIQPGVNQGKAVYFNAFWKDCHTDPAAVQEVGHPQTCGELRSIVQQGADLLDTGGPHVATLFTGSYPRGIASAFGLATLTAKQYNSLWKSWGGFKSRPADFDELVAQRYGSGFKQGRNPYPLPGEDPNKTNGGNGKLPEMFTQMRNPDGSWSGHIGMTCHVCHSGVVGTPTDGPGLGIAYGGSSSLADLNLFLHDALPLGYVGSAAIIANLSRSRGTSNASDINLAFLLPEKKPLPLGTLLGVLGSGSTASMDPPAWWNMGHRPLKFVDGVFPMDAPRVDAVFYTPVFGITGFVGGKIAKIGQDWMRANGPRLNAWVETLKSPAYPFPIDTQLAQTGAVLFHNLNLWAPSRNNPYPKPAGGNGSCASCHGAYSPRYVNDPAFLDTPELEGMASYIVPLNIIATDPARALTNNEAVQKAGSVNFFGYPPTKGTENDCGPQNQKRLRGDRPIGYLAPPLYGVWASAPYFHNGSVPNLWDVLKPSDRPTIWRRVSAPRPDGVPATTIMGYDTNLQRAYDPVHVGWKYDVIQCKHRTWLDPMVRPYINCMPNDPTAKPPAQKLLTNLYSHVVLTWNLLFPPMLTNAQMQDRKIYNTHMYSQGNEGHAFVSVLTDQERMAILEYLKTL